METATLELKDYNALRDFKVNLESGRIGIYDYNGWYGYRYLEPNELIEQSSRKIEKLKRNE